MLKPAEYKLLRKEDFMTLMERIKKGVPWWGKIVGKILISRLPLRNDYCFWKKLGLFVNGPMDNPEYAIRVFEKHHSHCNEIQFSCLELGCGDSLSSALIAKKHGAKRTYLVDVGDYADQNITTYNRLALALDVDATFESMDSYLDFCHASYLTGGLASLKTIPDHSVDFIFSQAVLEHIRKKEFALTIAELKRILRAGGRMSHSIDLKDHLGGKLNNLRFSETWWERDWVAGSGFYTNRLRYSEMMKLFQDEGLECLHISLEQFDKIPTSRSRMNEAFRKFTDDDLIISGIHVVMGLTGSHAPGL